MKDIKTGKIKYWNAQRGFGFILPDTETNPRGGIYFNRMSLEADYTAPVLGDKVAYVHNQLSEDRQRAENVELLRS